MSADLVLLDVSENIATITLNAPGQNNSLNVALAEALADAVHQVEANPSVRAVILTGTGKAFCSGGDIRSMKDSRADLAGFIAQLVDRVHATLLGLRRLHAPVITAINGSAAGGGLGIALAGDYAIAAASAKFRSAYTAIGFSGDCGTTYLLPRAIGERRARQLMLTNRALSAQEALDWGLVDAVVPDDQLGEESRRLAGEFAAGATRAIGTVKKLIDQSWRQAFETQLACEGTGMVAMGRSHDAQEAVAAFVEKRAPRFEGR